MRRSAPRQQSLSLRKTDEHHEPATPFAGLVAGSRFVVLLAVAAVLLVAVSLFVLGTGMAVMAVWLSAQAVVRGELGSTDLTVQFLEIVSVMLKAVIFYIIGVGFYSLFIAPLNLPTALGIATLKDLESKVLSAIVVIMAVTFLEHFIVWQKPEEVLPFGATLAVVVIALVAFQLSSHIIDKKDTPPLGSEERRARRALFKQGEAQNHLAGSLDGHHSTARRAR